MPQIQIIKDWFLEKNTKTPKRLLKNRVLAQASANIEAAEGLEQLWSKFWTVEFLPEDDPKSPLMPLTALEMKSGLTDLEISKDAKLSTPGGYRPGPANWT